MSEWERLRAIPRDECPQVSQVGIMTQTQYSPTVPTVVGNPLFPLTPEAVRVLLARDGSGAE